MVIKIYISGISGNKEVKKRQQRVLLILDSKNVKYEIIDIAEPGAEEAKDFMQNNSTSLGATIGDPSPRHALPPQIFNDDVYCGDYDMFDMANEVDEMEVFLKLEPNALNEQISTFETKLKNGDLSIDEKIDKVIGAKIDDEETKENEQDQVQDDNKNEEIEKEGSVERKEGSVERKEGSVERKEGSVERKEGSVERKEDNKEESAEIKEDNKEENAEIEDNNDENEEKEIGEDVENKEVDKEDKLEENENEDSDAAGDKTGENDEDNKDNDEKEELEKEASPEKSE